MESHLSVLPFLVFLARLILAIEFAEYHDFDAGPFSQDGR